ncbi:LysR family transcriptional regulator [Paracoccus laeviglucosivorans]|uniref:Transcriptional regulator, LysR family n=1 Tax=Paracoccus laeviglucosivorans TaxID=1197861 RepID=A0A521FL29_9RHOB|nr:LysR family transcriptional regulator [Paracoccus laeviglucosivorans]SMO96191.1 transcriptional regulator, LysR family [Paracoccus laeviglucosivorans]
MVRFTLRQCSYFRAVAEHGGIAQAARVLNISQPSVAQALEKLEAVTGLILFDRHHARGLTLTVQGRSFLEHVLKLEEQAAQVEREAAALAAELAGEIRLGVFWTLTPFFAVDLIRRFAKAEPALTITPHEMSLVNLAEAVREGSLDFALTYDRGADTTGLNLLELASLQPMVVVSADHPLAHRTSISLSELESDPYVMLDGPGSRHYFEGLLAENGMTPRISYVSSSLEAVRSAVAAGFGFTFLVMRPPSSETYDGREVRTLAITDNVRPLRIVLASREGVHRGLVARRFAEHARSYFTEAVGKPVS